MSGLSSRSGPAFAAAFALLCLLLLIVPRATLGQTAPNASPEFERLEINQIVEGRISGGQKHVYVVELAAAEFASIKLEQKGIDLFVKLIDKDGAPIAEFDSETRPNGIEMIEAVSVPAGSYKLEVEPRLKTAAAAPQSVAEAQASAAS